MLALFAGLLVLPLLGPIGLASPAAAPESFNAPTLRAPSPAELAGVAERARVFWSTVVPPSDADLVVAAVAAADDEGMAELDSSTLANALASARADWQAADPDAAVEGATATVGDLPGDQLAATSGSTITVDATAAGHGWGADGMDLATVLRHELGHVAGHDHDDAGLMEASLDVGEVHGVPAPAPTDTAGTSDSADDASGTEETGDDSTADDEVVEESGGASGDDDDAARDEGATGDGDAATSEDADTSAESTTTDDGAPEGDDGSDDGTPGGPDDAADGEADTDGSGDEADTDEGDSDGTATGEDGTAEEPVEPADDAVADDAGALSVDRAEVDLGRVRPGATATGSLVVTNDGAGDLDLAGVTLDDPTGSFTVSTAPGVLAPGASHEFTITFTGGSPGTHDATLTLGSDDPGGPTTIALTGTSSRWSDDGTVATATVDDGILDAELRLDGDTVGLVGADGVDVAPVDRDLVVMGSAGDDRLVLSGASSRRVTVDGGGGDDTLVGPGADLDWAVSGPDGGTVAGVVFVSFEHLVGAADTDDTFTIAEGGSLTGSVDGGSGGFDTLDVRRSVGSASSTATGPQSGIVTLDGVTFTYAGLEPVDVAGTDELTLTLADTADVATLQLDPGGLKLDVTSGTVEDHVFAVPTTSLTIDLGEGADALTIDAGVMAALAGVAVIIRGGGGSDTLWLDDDIAGQWDITGIDAGSWTQDDPTPDLLDLLGPPLWTFDFVDIQHLHGADTADDAFDFASGAGITGSIDDRDGELSVSAAGFVTVSGDLDFVTSSRTDLVARDDADLATDIPVGAATVLSVSSATGDDLAGDPVIGLVGAEVLDNPVGATGAMGAFALVVISTLGSAWHTFEGTLRDPDFVGPGLSIDAADLAIEVNARAGDDTFLDLSAASISMAGLTLDAAGPVIGATTTATIDLGGFVYLRGDVTLRSGGLQVVDVATGLPANLLTIADDLGVGDFANQLIDGLPAQDELADLGLNANDLHLANDLSMIFNVPVSVLEVAISNAALFIGLNFAWTDSDTTGVSGEIDEGELDPDAIGLFANGIDLTLLTMSMRLTDYLLLNRRLLKFTSLAGHVENLDFVGWDAVELTAEGIDIAVNDGTSWPGGLGPPVVDFATTYGDAGYVVDTPGGPVAFTFDGNQRIGASVDRARFTIDEVVQVAGTVAFEKGPTTRVDIWTGLPDELRAALTAFVDGGGLSTLRAAFDAVGAGDVLDIIVDDDGTFLVPVLAAGEDGDDIVGDVLTFSHDFGVLYNLEVSTMQVGGTDISVFLGFNAGWQDGCVVAEDDADTACDPSTEDGEIQASELSPDAVGLIAEGISFGMGWFDPTLPGLPEMRAMRFGLDTAQMLGGGLFTAAVGGVDAYHNGGDAWSVLDAEPYILFETSFPAIDDDATTDTIDESTPAGFAVGTGDPDDPVLLDFEDPVTGFSADTVLLSVGEYLTITGRLTFEDGGSQSVTVATGLPSNLLDALAGNALGELPDELEAIATEIKDSIEALVNALSGDTETDIADDWKSISNVGVSFMKMSVTDGSIFVGYNPGFDGTVLVDSTSGLPYLAGDDGAGDDCAAGTARNNIIDACELSEDAVGLLVTEANFGMVVATPFLADVAGLDWVPTFTAIRFTVDEAALVGVPGVVATLEGIEIQVNDGDPWPGDLGPPVIDWATSFPGDGGDPGFELGNDVGSTVLLDYDGNQRIRVSVGNATLRLGEYLQIAGSVFFEKGPTTLVDVATGFSTEFRIGLMALFGSELPATFEAFRDAGVTLVQDALAGTGLYDEFEDWLELLPVLTCDPTDLAACKAEADGRLAFTPDFKYLLNAEAATLQVGGSDISLWAGFNGAWTDTGDDLIQVDELGDDAIGLHATGVSFGLGIFEPTLGSLPAIGDLFPDSMYGFEAFVEEAALLGGGLFTGALVGATVNAYGGESWGFGQGPATIDFTSSYPEVADDPSTTTVDEATPAGFRVDTGTEGFGNEPVHLTRKGTQFGISATRALATISGVATITGGFAFQEGESTRVTVATGLPTNLIDLIQAAADAPGSLGAAAQGLVDAAKDVIDDFLDLVGGGTAISDDYATITDLLVKILRGGITNGSLFLGVNSGIAATLVRRTGDDGEDCDGSLYLAADIDCNGMVDRDELGEDAIGLFATGAQMGFVVMTPALASFTGLDWIPTFQALKFHVDEVSLVGVPGITATFTDVDVYMNTAESWPGGLGPPVVDWATTFPAMTDDPTTPDDESDTNGDGVGGDPMGYAVATGEGNDPVWIDFDGNERIGLTIGRGLLQLGDFVWLSGTFGFEMGPAHIVQVATGFPADVATLAGDVFGDLLDALGTTPSYTDDGTEDGDVCDPITEDPCLRVVPDDGTAISDDLQYLHNVEVTSLEFGATDVTLFLGVAPGGLDAGDDLDLTRAEVEAADSVGFYGTGIDFGFAIFTPTGTGLDALSAIDGQLPRFYALSADADLLELVGVPGITLAAKQVRVEVNNSTGWPGGASALIGTPVIDFALSWPAVDDDAGTADVDESDRNGDGIVDDPAGYDVVTGGAPVWLTFDGNQRIGGGAELLVVGIAEFVHLRGSGYFELGPAYTVPVVPVVAEDVLEAALDTLGFAGDLLDVILGDEGDDGVRRKQVSFFTLGLADVYAFIGVGGPHWTTVDPDDLTTDIAFEAREGTGADCSADDDPDDGVSANEENPDCRFVANVEAVGIAVSDLDVALAIGTPTFVADPIRYITLRASVDVAELVGLSDVGEGITASLRGIQVEVNIATPLLSFVPVLPVIDWEQYATDSGCTASDLGADVVVVTETCQPFAIRTGALDDDGEDVVELLLYDGVKVRAAVRLVTLDIFGIMVVRGSLAFNLGPGGDVTLVDGSSVSDLVTMTLAGLDLYAFVGIGGPHWTTVDDVATNDLVFEPTDDAPAGTDCSADDDPTDGVTAAASNDDCQLVTNPDAIGFALSNLDFALFVGVGISTADAGVFLAAEVDLGALEVVGIPGLTASGTLGLQLNLGFALTSGGASMSGINFLSSFTYEDAGGVEQAGLAVDTGSDPMILAFDRTFLSIEAAGFLQIHDLARIDGLFALGLDFDAGNEELRLFALGEMTIGPDIGSSDPLVQIGAVGVIILNSQGVAADFGINLSLDVPLLELTVDARLIFNSTGFDQEMRLPDRLLEYMNGVGSTADCSTDDNPDCSIAGADSLVASVLASLVVCEGDPSDAEPACYRIDARAPRITSTVDGRIGADEGTIGALLRQDGYDDGDITWTACGGTDEDACGAYVVVVLAGDINIAGFATATGLGAVAVSGDRFELVLAVEFMLGVSETVGLSVDARAVASISSEGLQLSAQIDIDADLLSVFTLDLGGTLTIDTRAGHETFILATSGSVDVLSVIEMSGSVVIYVGGELGEDQWYVGASLSADFGPLELSASGFIASWGSFKFTLTGRVDLTIAGTGIEGRLTAHASYCLRSGGDTSKTCRDDLSNYYDRDNQVMEPLPAALLADLQALGQPQVDGSLPDGGRTFLASVEGSVKVKILGITLAGVEVEVSVSGALGSSVKVKARFTVETLFGDVTKTVTIATFTLPDRLINADIPPPNLAELQPDGTLLLNVGDRGNRRTVSPNATDEEYEVFLRCIDPDLDGPLPCVDHYVVSAFGRTEAHLASAVTDIEGRFGEGNDSLVVYPDVTAPVLAHGGTGDDRLAASGSGAATLYGEAGNDILIGGSANDTLVGGTADGCTADCNDDDFLDGQGGVDTMIGGDGDDVFFGYGSQLAGETLDPGLGYDSLEVVGALTSETIVLSLNDQGTTDTSDDDLELSYDGATPLVLTGLEYLLLRLQGSDDLTLTGAVDSVGLQDLVISSAPYQAQVLATQADRDECIASLGAGETEADCPTVGEEIVPETISEDTVTLNLLGTDDTVLVSGAMEAAPPTLSQGDGVFEVEVATPADVPTLRAEWIGHITFVVANTGLVVAAATPDHDTVTINTLGGADDIAVTSLLTDLTIDLGAGADEVVVGSAATCDAIAGTCSNPSGVVSTIDAPLDLDGGTGTDSLDVDDTSDTSGDTLLVTKTLLDGLDLHPDGIAYTGFATIDVRLGSGGDTIDVQGTSGVTTIEARGGNDIFNVSSDAGTNAGSLVDIDADLVLDGGTGTSDLATISDRADTTGDTGSLTNDTFTGYSNGDITYLALETLNLDLGSGDDRLTVVSVHGGVTTIDLGAGADDLALQSAPTGSTVTIHGEAGDDDVELGSLSVADDGGAIATGGTIANIDGVVTIDGDAPQASDRLWLDDTGNGGGTAGTITRSTITGFGMAGGVTYRDVEHLQVALGDGIDLVDVTSTNGPGNTDADSETDTTLLLGGGDDVVDVSSTGSPTGGTVNTILGALTIDGQGGSGAGAGDTVNVSDWADGADNTGELTSTLLTGLGMGADGITYAGLEYLNIRLGTGNDTFVVHSTHAGETGLWTRAGNDTVDVGGSDQTIDDVVGLLDVDMGTGDDDLTVNDQATATEQVGTVTASTVEGLGATIDANNTASDRVSVLTIEHGSYGDVVLTIDGNDATFALNATGAEVAAAIVAALGASPGEVLVSRTSLIRLDGTTFRITFTGALGGAAGHDLGAITVDTSGLVPLDAAVAIADRVVDGSTGRIAYTGVETLEVNLGSDTDHVELASTGAVTTINGWAGNDVLDVETIDHATEVFGGTGNDSLQVNLFAGTPDTNDIDADLTLNGGNDSDTFFVQLSSTDESFVTVDDSGSSGIDDLVVQGTDADDLGEGGDDQFLLRAELVALLNGFVDVETGWASAEFVFYGDGIENLVVRTLSGDDSVALDDTTVATTIDLGDGDDSVQVGQLFGEACLDGFDTGIPEGPGSDACFDPQFVPPFLLDTTQGMLSNGISESTTVNGGAGNDLMLVFRNRAVLTLNGEDGDDTFVIRTFIEEDSETQLVAGAGADTISYAMNAPVNVNGGDGYDRLYIIGTEADDVFVVTADGVYGGGRFIDFAAIELLAVDAVEGNDRIHVLSTDAAVAVEVYGGLGSDTIEVASNLVPTVIGEDGSTTYAPVYVPADDLVGHSALVVHEIEEGIGAGTTIDGVAAEVVDDDEAAVLLIESDGSTVVTERASGSTDDFVAWLTDTYQVRLTKRPDSKVRIDALTAILTNDQINSAFGPEFNVELSLTGADGTWDTRGIVLVFDETNWWLAQTIHVRAVIDTGREGDRTTAVRHTVEGYLDGVVAAGSTATTLLTVDTSAFLLDGVVRDLSGLTLVLRRAGGDEELYEIASNTAGSITVVGGFDDGIAPAALDTWEVRGVGEYDAVVLNDLFVRMLDDDVEEVVAVESGVGTTVSEDGTTIDSYQLGLTGTGTTEVEVTIDLPAGICVAVDGGAMQCDDVTVALTPGEVVTIVVTAVDDDIVEGFRFSTIRHLVAGGEVGVLVVGTIDDDTHPDDVQVIIEESDGATVVTEGVDEDTDGPVTTDSDSSAQVLDSYTIRLSGTLAAGETVTVTARSIPTLTQVDDGTDRITREAVQVELRFRPVGGGVWSAWALSHELVFTVANLATGFEVQLRAVQDDVVDGRILQATAEAPARVNRIQGALYVDGGPSTFGYPLANFTPVMLPGESSPDLRITPNSSYDVIEQSAVDTLVVHDEDDVADQSLDVTTASAQTSTLSDGFHDYLDSIGAAPDGNESVTVSRYALLGLGMGPRGIEYDGIEALDVLLGSGVDTVEVVTTHVGTTTIRGHDGDDVVTVREILGHTRILGGAGDDTVTVTDDAGTLESIDAQLLVSGEGGDDTVVVDDSGDDRSGAGDDDTGTLTQTSLVGFDMVSTTVDDLFSLELSADVTGFRIRIQAFRAAGTLDVDDPGVDIDQWVDITDAAIAALVAIGQTPYGDYRSYDGATVVDGLDGYLLAGLIQQALFPYLEPLPADGYIVNEDGTLALDEDLNRQWVLPDGSIDDDRYLKTGCGRLGTTGERDSRCANSVYVWESGERVGEPGSIRVLLVGFQGELAGLDVTFEVVAEHTAGQPTGTYATDLLRTDGITYDTLETLDIRLGDGHDRFNVRGTLATTTLLDTGPGDDVVYVSDAAASYADQGDTQVTGDEVEGFEGAIGSDPAEDLEELHERTLHGTVNYDDRTYVGTLDEVDGDLVIEVGTGSNTLAVSDHQSAVADTGFTISADTIAGLADGTITYGTTGGDVSGQGFWTRGADVGMFGRGITVHLGTGADVGTVESVLGGAIDDSPLQVLITTVYGNDGDDTIMVDAPDVAEARLVVYGDDGDDTVDGTDASLELIMFGEDGRDDLQGGSNDDVLFGDDGRVVLYRDVATDGLGAVYDVVLGGAPVDLPAAVVAGGSTLADADTYADDGVFETIDVLYTLYPQAAWTERDRADVVRGGAGDDVLLGGVDGDALDGQAGRDVVLGDRGILTRNLGGAAPTIRTLAGTTLAGGVTTTHRVDPLGTWRWTITLLDHDATIQAGDATRWGDDMAAGGAGHDLVFGQLGDDVLHGDGVLLTLAGGPWTIVAATDPSTDGDDHVEGNGGDDVVHGGLGRDSIIGGSSDLFGLVTRAMRPDGSDTIFGGNGDHATRNDTAAGLDNGRDADTIVGDNGNVFRIVTAAGGFATFTYVADVIPTVAVKLDYTPIGGAGYWFVADPADPATATWVVGTGTNIGAADTIHGESGDDVVHGMTGDDVLYGDAHDDDLYGGEGGDWISGGAGTDGIIGDEGYVLTARNGTAEPLHGRPATTEDEIAPSGDKLDTTIYATGRLRKTVELDIAITGATFTTFRMGANDILYGGWGNDFVHANEGDDFLSGAEAPDQVYGGADYFDDPFAFLDAVYGPDQYDAACGGCRDVLQHGFRPGEFRWYDENDPLARIEVEAAGGGTVWFLGDVVPENVAGGGDGDDRLFGDGGFDWLVGGTGADWMFGGWGDDLHDGDDDKTTNGGANDVVDTPDPSTSYADVSYGGAGRDILIGNSEDDRMFDWSGEFNSYWVPYNPFGRGPVTRSPAPHIEAFLLALGTAAGADITRCAGNTLCTGGRNGEPFGELGMVLQQDAAWGDQKGSPDDPQPGNKGGKKGLATTAAAADPVTTTLSSDDLDRLVAAAVATWRSAGVDVAVLEGLSVVLRDLDGASLGLADGATIELDTNAAGWGWHVGDGPVVEGSVDLLTVLLHELGHVLGLDHQDGGVMAAVLAPGVRWVLDAASVAPPAVDSSTSGTTLGTAAGLAGLSATRESVDALAATSSMSVQGSFAGGVTAGMAARDLRVMPKSRERQDRAGEVATVVATTATDATWTAGSGVGGATWQGAVRSPGATDTTSTGPVLAVAVGGDLSWVAGDAGLPPIVAVHAVAGSFDGWVVRAAAMPAVVEAVAVGTGASGTLAVVLTMVLLVGALLRRRTRPATGEVGSA
ncbi:choice-of-anchor D domain-containing protein [Salsipaludibacter albus]|uniref:choice-of-anchor D domain-containing protein n=1 Tax=Salsipaludibacter albus TaxID=2849650 RepID=UPI001EE475DF|nr:choice-of-anchor D domain-containing protein [Salsipaludibacter albus]MBY5161789.1 choice-of-anchor D domain-containing protein [Salsipaludibacter albus]